MNAYLFLNLDAKPVEWAVIVARNTNEAVLLTGWTDGTAIVTSIPYHRSKSNGRPWLVARGKLGRRTNGD